HHRLPLQAVRHVLDRARGERHPGIAMLPFQRPLRGLLGGASPGGLISTSTSRTLCPARPDRESSHLESNLIFWPFPALLRYAVQNAPIERILRAVVPVSGDGRERCRSA